MTKKEFIEAIQSLARDAENIEFGNKNSALKVLEQFELFFHENHKYLNQFTLEHIGMTKFYFNEMINTKKKFDDRVKAWQNGIHFLVADIESMKSQNSYPNDDIEGNM